MNTKIHYLYRDAANYKIPQKEVFEGEFSEEQINTIMDCLMDGNYFIPSCVGMEEERFSDWDEEDDHPYFELYRDGFEKVKDAPSSLQSPEDLVSAFLRMKDNWDTAASKIIEKVASKAENPLVLKGSEPLDADRISFEDEIIENDDSLNFYISVDFDADKVFGTHVETYENDDFLNVYANYNLLTKEVEPFLTVILVGIHRDEEFKYLLTEEQQKILEEKMDQYCRNQTNRSLKEYRAMLQGTEINFDNIKAIENMSTSDILFIRLVKERGGDIPIEKLKALAIRLAEFSYSAEDPRFTLEDYADSLLSMYFVKHLDEVLAETNEEKFEMLLVAAAENYRYRI